MDNQFSVDDTVRLIGSEMTGTVSAVTAAACDVVFDGGEFPPVTIRILATELEKPE